MASSILTQVYKEAAVTSKGVVQMNRTLDKIYADQLKANKAQAKFLDDLRTKNKREEREEKKRQSDLRKLLNGKKEGPGSSSGDKDDGGGLGGLGGILGAITGAIGAAFNLLKDLLVNSILNRLRKFFKLPKKVRPTRRPTGGQTGGQTRGSKGKGPTGKGKGKGKGPTGKGPTGKGPTGKGPTGKGPTGKGKGPSRALQPSGGNQQVRSQPGNPRLQRPPAAEAIKGKPTPVKAPPAPSPTNVSTRPGGSGKGLIQEVFDPKNYSLKNVKDFATSGRALTSVRGLAKGAIVGMVVDYVAQLAVDAGDKLMIEAMLKRYVEMSEEEQKKFIEMTEKQINTNKEYIEGKGIGGPSLFWLDRTIRLGGETDAEHQYRIFTSIQEGINLIKEAKETTELSVEAPPTQQLARGGSILDVPTQKRARGGGIFDVPGHGQGDQVPMMLPPGSFVLNRVAAQEMFARGGEPSGMVPTLLEPGEKVFMPGDPMMDMAMMFNEAFSRFQTGGHVGIATEHIKKDEALSSLTKGQNDWIKEGMSSLISKTPWSDLTLETKIHAYLDKYKVATIGWGNTYYDNIRNGKQPVKMGDEITKDKADKIMNKNVSALASDYSREIPHWNKMSNMQRAALISMGYNAPNFYVSETFAPKLKKSLQEGDMEAAANNLSWKGPSPKRISEAKSMMKRGPKDLSKEMSGLTPTASDLSWYKGAMKLQKGGVVDDGASRGLSQPPSGKDAKPGSGKGVEAILSAAESNIGLSKGVGEQCANTTRSVLKAAGHPAGTKTTQKGDLDPEGTKYNGPGFAASFAGSDMGAVNKNFNSVKPGEVMLWKDTYKKYSDQPAGAITHVGIAGEDNMQYDHSKARGWEKVPRESRNFAASIDLNGEASGDGENNSSSNGSAGSDGIFGDVLGGLTSSMSNMFGGMGDVMGPAMNAIKEVMGPINEQLKSVMGDIMGEMKEVLGSEEMKGMLGGAIGDLKSEMGDISGRLKETISQSTQSTPSQPITGKMSSSPQMMEHIKKIKEAMDPDQQEGNETIVQVMPGETQQAKVEGMTSDNRPPQLSVRCSSWAAADYRYDRSLNTPTQ